MPTRSERSHLHPLAALAQDPSGTILRALGTGALAATASLLLGAALLRLRARLRAYIARRRTRRELRRQGQSLRRGRHG